MDKLRQISDEIFLLNSFRKEERETPDTIVSSSSPEFGFNEQETEYPGLRPIDPAKNNTVPEDVSTSPVVPLIQPLPVKPGMFMQLKFIINSICLLFFRTYFVSVWFRFLKVKKKKGAFFDIHLKSSHGGLEVL